MIILGPGSMNKSRAKKSKSLYEEIIKQAQANSKIMHKKKSKSPGHGSSNKKKIKDLLKPLQYQAAKKDPNQSAIVTPSGFHPSKLIKRHCVNSDTNNSPNKLSRCKSPENNMMGQVQNMKKLLDCLNHSEKHNVQNVNISEDLVKMLRGLLKNELNKIFTDHRISPTPICNKRRDSAGQDLYKHEKENLNESVASNRKMTHKMPTERNHIQIKHDIRDRKSVV